MSKLLNFTAKSDTTEIKKTYRNRVQYEKAFH